MIIEEEGTTLANPVRPRGVALAQGLGAFAFIFLVYAGISTAFVPLVTEGLPLVYGPPLPLTAADYSLTLYWAGFAIIGIAVSIAVTVWTVMLLRSYLVTRSFLIALSLLAAAAVFATWLLLGRAATMVELPQRLTCGLHPLVSAGPGFRCGTSSSLDARELLTLGPDWTGAVIRLKFWLNAAFQMAAIAVIGGMLTITSVCRAANDQGAMRKQLVSDQAMLKMLVAGGLVLSAITLTDIIFANWPLVMLQTASGKASDELVGIMTAVIFFYAILGSVSLGLAIFFARGFGKEAMSFVPIEGDSGLGLRISQAQSWLGRDSTIKALVALSPVLTTAIGSPIVRLALGAITGKDLPG